MKGIGYLTADAFAKSWQQQARWNQFLAFSRLSVRTRRSLGPLMLNKPRNRSRRTKEH